MSSNLPPALTEQERQAAIAECVIEIAHLKQHIVDCEQNYRPSVRARTMLNVQLMALAGFTAEPIYQLVEDGNWFDTQKYLFDEAVERDEKCRIVYEALPATVPVEPPKSQPCPRCDGKGYRVDDLGIIPCRCSSTSMAAE